MEKTILSGGEINRIICSECEKIIHDVGVDSLALVGIQTRGVNIAERMQKTIAELSGKHIERGTLDITFCRDDLATRGRLPVIKETRIDFDITQKTIILVDDVLFTGRTVKAALETITTFGRPQKIKLFVLVDRGNRELPIQADYCGCVVDTLIDDRIQLYLSEADGGEDRVLHIRS